MWWFVSLFVLKELAPAKQLSRSQLCCQHRFSAQKRRPKKQSIPLLRIITILFSNVREEICADCKSAFSSSPCRESSDVSSELKKLKTKKGAGTATILTITEMLQQYKNSGTVARLTALTLMFTERNT